MTDLPIQVPVAPSNPMIEAGALALRAAIKVEAQVAEMAVRRIYIAMLAAFVAQPILAWTEAATEMAYAIDRAALTERGWSEAEINHAMKAVGEPSSFSRDEVAAIWPMVQALALRAQA